MSLKQLFPPQRYPRDGAGVLFLFNYTERNESKRANALNNTEVTNLQEIVSETAEGITVAHSFKTRLKKKSINSPDCVAAAV